MDGKLFKLVGKTNNIFQSLKKIITEKELKYFTYKYEKAINLRKLYLFS